MVVTKANKLIATLRLAKHHKTGNDNITSNLFRKMTDTDVDMEFLYTKDPMFFNKPPTKLVTFRIDNEEFKVCYRLLPEGNQPPKNDTEEPLAPYEDNESK